MELVYLWVEEYKNIKNQGFNFSPKFECEYDGENLTINEKEEYVSIFPDNINVTAIVGENGSGKSSILNSLIEIYNVLNSNQNDYNKIYKNLSELKYIILVFIGKNKKKYIFEITNNKSMIKNVNQYNHKLINNSCNNSCDIDNFKLFHYDYSNTIYKPYQKNHTKLIMLDTTNISSIYELYKGTNNIYLVPDKVNNNIFNLNNEKILLFKYIVQNKNLIIKKYFEPSKIEIEFNTLITDNKQVSDILKKRILVYLKQHSDTKEEFKTIDNINSMDEYLKKKNEQEKNYMKVTMRYSTSIDNNIHDCLNFLNFLNKNILNYNLLFKVTTNKKLIVNDFKLLKNNIELISKLPTCCFNVNILNNNNINYESLSNGEKVMLKIKAYILLFIDKYLDENIMILLDEPDNELHPNWQKKLFNYLIESFKDKKQKIHFIFTTHSPFLLSDIPKENIIFLEKGKQVYPDIETFGANIHTLLSHGFFMKDGLMGEFAKGKIDEAIKILNLKQLSEDDIKFCENIISIVGEPILKRQMQKMLDSKRLTKVDKIDALEAEIELMKL